MSANVDQNNRPDYDPVLQDIADYVLNYRIDSPDALDTARNCLMDTLGCGLLALRFPECTKHLGPIVEGTVVPFGGTSAASCVGSITTTPGSPPNGAILRITSVAFSPSLITCRKNAWPMARRR